MSDIGYPLAKAVVDILVISPDLRDDATVNSPTVDMQDAEYVEFLLAIGDTDIVVDLKAQEGDESDGSDAADITGALITQVTATDDDKGAILAVHKTDITKRYVRVVLVVGNGTLGADTCVWARKVGTDVQPTAKDATVLEIKETAPA